MKTNTNAIQVKGLRKNFGKLEAVRGVSFAVQSGEIFSLLGPNGAGKSTTISMLSGLLEPTAGDAEIGAYSVKDAPAAAKAALGVVPQDIALYPDLTAFENLMFWGKMYGLRGSELRRRVAEILEMIGLTDRKKDRIGTFSGGMKRRVNIGAALLHQPKVVIMDEPTVGIDPQSRRHILDSVKALNRQGMTVLYTIHYMEEAEELSDHIAIMDHGEIIASGTYAELIRLIGEQTRVDLSVSADPDIAVQVWQNVPGVSKVSRENGSIQTLMQDSNAVLPRLFEAAGQANVRITGVDIREPNLEAVFLHLTGRALRD